MGERSENFVLQEDTKGFFGLCAWGSLLGLIQSSLLQNLLQAFELSRDSRAQYIGKVSGSSERQDRASEARTLTLCPAERIQIG